MRTPRSIIALLAALALVAAACGSDDSDDTSSDTTAQDGTDAGDDTTPDGPVEPTGVVISVPDDHATIQEAVDAAEPGDLVLIEEGVYNEAVDVTTPYLTIRGVDRNEVILDGEFELDNGIRVVADGVAVENMTARNYARNGFFWTGVEGYRGSYLTSYRTGDYGVYAFDSVKGQIEHAYAAGSPDAGFYIGQCYPCDAVIFDVISEYNGLGYSGTNAGGNLIIANSTWRYNRAGIVPNSGSYELCFPQRDNIIVGNIVHDNNQPDTPAIGAAIDAMGNGILVAGGNLNVIERNLVENHDLGGIVLVPFPEDGAVDVPPDPDTWDQPCAEVRDQLFDGDPDELDFIFWQPSGNSVRNNLVRNSGLGDIGFGTVGAELADLDNCFSDNDVTSAAPTELEALAPCDGEPTSDDWEAGAFDLLALLDEDKPPAVDYDVAPTPDPPAQPSMPDARTAPARPATDVPMQIDVDAITVPSSLEG